MAADLQLHPVRQARQDPAKRRLRVPVGKKGRPVAVPRFLRPLEVHLPALRTLVGILQSRMSGDNDSRSPRRVFRQQGMEGQTPAHGITEQHMRPRSGPDFVVEGSSKFRKRHAAQVEESPEINPPDLPSRNGESQPVGGMPDGSWRHQIVPFIGDHLGDAGAP